MKGTAKKSPGKIDRRAIRADGEKTRAAILDAAEELFAEHGVNGPSLRTVMQVANVNVSLISYHFGSRENLIRAILQRRVRQLMDDRFALLDQARALSGDEKLLQMLRAYLLPITNTDTLAAGASRRLLRIIGHLSACSEPWADALLQEFFDDFQIRFVEELAREFPHLSRTDLYWRLHLLRCVNIHTPVGAARTKSITGGAIDPADPEKVGEAMFPLLMAALKTPPTAEPARKERPAG